MKRAIAVSVVLLLCVSSLTYAQTYPATLRVPVTFYDFHSNGSNPDFEPGLRACGATGCMTGTGLHLNEVRDTLDANRKPILGTSPYFSQRVAKWFRPWLAGDFTVPIYSNAGGYLRDTTLLRDTAYKDSVIPDTLVFNLVPASAGVYTFTNNAFFRLDGKGFGNEPPGQNPPHNFGFSMELHWDFTYQTGLTFNFEGDDDVWVFINGHRVIDLGGIHSAIAASVNLDTLKGMTIGQKYSLDMFYAERHVTGSDIIITSNVVSTPPTKIAMTVVPNYDTLPAGAVQTYTAHVKKSDTTECDVCDQNVHWTLTSVPTYNQSYLTPISGVGQTATFNAVTAYTTNYIKATFDTVINGVSFPLTFLDTIYVKPGLPNHLSIEAQSDSTKSDLNHDVPLPFINIDSATHSKSVYAILRDSLGNWVSHATNATWTSPSPVIASVQKGDTLLGEGIISRGTITNAAHTNIFATKNNMTDSVDVRLSTVSYTKINIVVKTQDTIGIDSLKMRTDQDTILYAVGRRADNPKQWDTIQVDWSNSPALGFTPKAPSTTSKWAFQPIVATTGKIYITFGLLRDSITAIFSPGRPNTVNLYPAPGPPGVGTNIPYVSPVSVVAGTPLPIIAKLFSQSNEWLSLYERRDKPFSWKIDELTGATNSGTLDTSFGFQVNFTGTKAYQVVKVTVTFSDSGITISKSINIAIQPGAPTKLVLEPDSTGRTAYPNSPHRADSVTIGQTSTTASVYAVLRDAYNNFVRFSDPTLWLSRDTTQVKVTAGNPAYGEGICQRDTSVGQAWVIARDSVSPSLTDSVLIKLSNIYYTKLRIVVDNAKTIPVLGMTIDDDTLLKVQGFRSDGAGWDYIPAAWSISSNLTAIPGAPGSSITWRFAPGDTGTGWIKVNLPDTTAHATPDSLKVIFSPGRARNIVLYPAEGNPASIQPYPGPTFMVLDSAGRSLPVVAKVFDKAGIWHPEWENAASPVVWTIVELPSNKSTPTGSLMPTTGDKTGFTAHRAFNYIYIIATFTEPISGTLLKDTIQVKTVPGPAARLVIEPTPDSSISPNKDNRAGSVTIASTALKDSVYAVLRDADSNFVSHALLAQWLSRDGTIVGVQKGDTSIGQGVITRRTISGTSVYVVATQGTMKDSVQVILAQVGYSRINIANGNDPKDTNFTILRMRTDQDTTLFAFALLNNGTGTWVPVTVSWGPDAGMTFVPNPKDSSSWTFQPTTPDSGFIRIVLGSLRDSIVAVFNYGNPDTMRLYPKSGQPDVTGNTPYPDTITVTAGQALPLWAKLFSLSNQWLKGYERSDAPVTWKIDELTGATNSATLTNYTSGSSTTFTGIKAYQKVKVTATFSENGITLTRSIVVSITPGAPARLVIEPDTTGRTAYPNVAHRAGAVTLLSSDTVKSVYAVLRDSLGNFVSFSNPTSWLSRDTTQAGVRGGNAAIGEGILIRKIDKGQTWVIATDGKNPAFTDSVQVILSNIFYTKLRIVTGDSTPVTSLTLSIDQSAELKVQGFRSDNTGWDYVPGQWGITGSITTATQAPGASINWIVVPSDTGSGYIKVSFSTATPDSIPVHFTLGAPASIVLYPADGNPSGLQPYPDPGQAITDSAGNALPVVAKVFDKAHDWLSSYETSVAPVTWRIVELPGNTDIPTGTTVPTSGYKTTLSATKASNSILVIAEFKSGSLTFDDSIKVTVVPGKPNHLVIESDNNPNASPHRDNPDTLVQIPSSETYALVFAIIRDAYGNFIDVSHKTAWLSLDSAVVTADNGGIDGQGQITRTPGAPRDRAQVTATSLVYAGLKDTTTAVALQYYYLALRIVDPLGNPIRSLAMNTNQDTTLFVQGQRSTDGVWEYTSVQWQSLGGLSIVPSAPANARSWTFSPDKPGTGTIRVVSLNNDTVTTKPDHIDVTFTVGPPTNVQIQILTPPDSLIAGDTIVSVVKITNKDGLVPGQYCDSTDYLNALGGLVGHSPVVIADTTVTMGNSMRECFNNGLDTVRFVLYRAPASIDSLEKITVVLKDLSATTEPFLMHPGDLARIAIQDASGKNLDTVDLTGSQLFISVGYDAFGNARGPENGNWKADSTLHPITNGSNVSRVFYQSSQSKYDEAGHIIATATGKNGAPVTDSAYVYIGGSNANLTSAITQDSSGNGYLDHIIIRFDKLVTITKEYPADSIVITATGDDGKKYTLPVDSIRGRSSSTDSVFVIYLSEPQKGTDNPAYGQPQTDWTPSITMPKIPGVSPISGYVSTDRAGPVVWTVVKTISPSSPSSRSSDLVVITFSEPISTNGNGFNVALQPANVLHVWKDSIRVDGTDTLVPADNLLAGISEFFQLSSDGKTLSFYMANNKDLTSRDRISIVIDSTGKSLADKSTSANIPGDDNQRVQVAVQAEPPKEIKVVPNPSGPNFTHFRNGPGQMHLEYNPNARDWVRVDGSGVVLTFDVTPRLDPTDPTKLERVTGVLKIYDMIGNQVFSLDSSQSKDGIFPPSWKTSDTSTFHFDMYWNGSNSRGQRVAPGIYRTMLYLKYEHDARPKRYIGTAGISR